MEPELWWVTALYCPAQKQRVLFEKYGQRVETYVPAAAGREWSMTIYAEMETEACAAVRNAYCLRGIENDFVFRAVRASLIPKEPE